MNVRGKSIHRSSRTFKNTCSFSEYRKRDKCSSISFSPLLISVVLYCYVYYKQLLLLVMNSFSEYRKRDKCSSFVCVAYSVKDHHNVPKVIRNLRWTSSVRQVSRLSYNIYIYIYVFIYIYIYRERETHKYIYIYILFLPCVVRAWRAAATAATGLAARHRLAALALWVK